MEKVGTIIRNHRIAKGITQEALGNQVFVSKQAVSKSVVQTISYETDDNMYQVIVTEAATNGNALSVFREGV